MRSPEPGDAPGTPPGPPSPIFLILVCPPETLPSPGFASTFCLSGGGLSAPSLLAVDPRGVGGPCFWCSPLRRSRRPQLCALVGLGRSQPPPSPGSSRRLMLPPPPCSARGHWGGGRDTARPPGMHPAALRPLCRAGSSAAAVPPALPFLPSPRSPVPCPCLLHVDTSPGLFGVHAHWALLGQGPVSSQSVWMMLLKHNM